MVVKDVLSSDSKIWIHPTFFKWKNNDSKCCVLISKESSSPKIYILSIIDLMDIINHNKSHFKTTRLKLKLTSKSAIINSQVIVSNKVCVSVNFINTDVVNLNAFYLIINPNLAGLNQYRLIGIFALGAWRTQCIVIKGSISVELWCLINIVALSCIQILNFWSWINAVLFGRILIIDA